MRLSSAIITLPKHLKSPIPNLKGPVGAFLSSRCTLSRFSGSKRSPSLRDGHTLRHGKRILASIEPDKDWPGMWRVRLPNGQLTDTVNLTWAKDAAVVLALDMSAGRAGAVF